jgi:hypothetical protein
VNNDQFKQSMARILSFTQAPKTKDDTDNLNRYLNALYEAIGNMDAFLFEKVTIELAKNMGRGQRPMPGQFWAVYSRLKAEDSASKPTEVCPSCRNTIWTMVRMMETKTGMEAEFAEPCHGCQQRHSLRDAPARSGWIKVERKASTHNREMLEKARTMGARGARFVLDLIEKHKTVFSDDVILALVERAGSEPTQSNPAAEAVLSKLEVIPDPVSREAAPMVAVGSPDPAKIIVNGEEYEVEE